MKRCEYCGKIFETKILRKRFCCSKCRQKAGYITEALKIDEKIKRAVEKRETKRNKAPASYIKIGTLRTKIARRLGLL